MKAAMAMGADGDQAETGEGSASSSNKMLEVKRGGDDLTRSIHMTEQVSGRVIMASTRDAWAGLSDWQKLYLSKSVASIALCSGSRTIFSCSGIAMERKWSNTRFLTSATLGEVLNDPTIFCQDLEIEVRLDDNVVYSGSMDEYDSDHNFAVVSVPEYLDVGVGPLQRALEILPHGEVLVAVARDVSGKIMAKSVELNGEDEEVVGFDESELLKDWEGGPVLFADHVVGMNLYVTTRAAFFKPWGTILKPLENIWTSQQMSKIFRFGARPMGEKSITYPHIVQGYYFKKDMLDLNSLGYPKLPSTMLGTGMILVNTFEDKFGDIHGKRDQGIWSKLRKRASNIDRNVVALASFKGEKRIFACSGFFIEQNECATILTSASLLRDSDDENKIVENLRIEVLIQGKLREGTLQDYNLHCNVAVISVKGYRALRPLNTVVATDFFKVAAVGRRFESRELMAAGGEMVDCTGTLDCKVLMRSTCKITKAGIGGPLVNLDGDVVGMNFFDTRIGTPYLPWKAILEVLSWFARKRKPGEVDRSITPFCKLVVGDEKGVLNRWPVPMPHWRHPDFVDGDASDDDLDSVDSDESDDELVSKTQAGSKRRKFFYSRGVKLMLF